MLPALLLAVALTGAEMDPLTLVMERYRTVYSWRVTLHCVHANAEEHLRYFYPKPGFVRIEFI